MFWAPTFTADPLTASLTAARDTKGGQSTSSTPETAAEIMGGAILETLRSLFSASADNISLLYGGSMNAGNAGDYAAQGCIHGGLVGGAALQAESFLQVAAAIAAAKS